MQGIKAFFITLIFLSNLHACYLCSVTDPTVYAYTKLIADQEKIYYIEVKWEFSQLYATKSAQTYDENVNGKIDPKEQEEVEKIFFEILEDNKYNTTIHINNKAIDIMDKIVDKRVVLDYEELTSYFRIKIDEPITSDLNLAIDYIDNNGILAYFIKPSGLTHTIEEPIIVSSNIEDYTLPLEISFNKQLSKKTETSATRKEKPDKGISIYFAEILSQTSLKMNRLVMDIKENSSALSFFTLLLFSFIYGIIHAAGPGHGKSLVASYMLSHNKDVKKAFFIASMIAFVHVFSAFIMTFGIYYILNEFFTKYIDSAENLITKISGVVIIAIALYMLLKKLQVAKENKKYKFSLHKPECGCSACNLSNTTTDIGVIISAGIIPCPGTVTIFIFTLSLGAYFLGFLAALVMSVGMSLVIFVTAVLSIKLRKNIKNNNLSKILDYLSLIFILLLGIFLTFY